MLTVRPAEPADLPEILDIMNELDRFYGATEIDARPEKGRGLQRRAQQRVDPRRVGN